MTCELTDIVDPDGRETRVIVAGVLDTSSANRCLKHMLKAMRATCPRLAVDLSQTTLVDACGLGILAAARDEAITLGGDLRLTGVPGYLWPMIGERIMCDADPSAHRGPRDGPQREAARSRATPGATEGPQHPRPQGDEP